MANARISIRLNKEIEERLQKEIQATGMKESEVVRQALTEYFEHRAAESCLDLARRHGLIGCAKQLPVDLSTNRGYFKGFGR